MCLKMKRFNLRGILRRMVFLLQAVFLLLLIILFMLFIAGCSLGNPLTGSVTVETGEPKETFKNIENTSAKEELEAWPGRGLITGWEK